MTNDPRWEILTLIHRYAELIDGGDFAGVAALLADAEVTAAGAERTTRGAGAIEKLFAGTTRRYDDGTPRTKHVTTNVIVEMGDDGTTATARSYFTVLQSVPGVLALQPVIAGRYADQFALVDGAWRFSARHIVPELLGDLSAHLLFDL
jgi:SnoaL-like protein